LLDVLKRVIQFVFVYITWNGDDNNGKSVATGVYFYKLKADKKVINRKMLLMK